MSDEDVIELTPAPPGLDSKQMARSVWLALGAIAALPSNARMSGLASLILSCVARSHDPGERWLRIRAAIDTAMPDAVRKIAERKGQPLPDAESEEVHAIELEGVNPAERVTDEGLRRHLTEVSAQVARLFDQVPSGTRGPLLLGILLTVTVNSGDPISLWDRIRKEFDQMLPAAMTAIAKARGENVSQH